MDAAFEKTYRLCCRGLCTAEAVHIIKNERCRRLSNRRVRLPYQVTPECRGRPRNS
jgi:hypothetical protein